jgi:hypothetical protein
MRAAREYTMRIAHVNDLADQMPLLHEAQCDRLGVPDAPANRLADIHTDRDELIRYAQKLRPCYDRLGRIIGQLAGIFILARFGKRFETDWSSVARVREQVCQTEVELHAVWVPEPARAHFDYLVLAFERTARVSEGFDANVRKSGLLDEQLDRWTRELKIAGAMLSAAAVERLGLFPVDFSQACCSCAGGKPSSFSLQL